MGELKVHIQHVKFWELKITKMQQKQLRKCVASTAKVSLLNAKSETGNQRSVLAIRH